MAGPAEDSVEINKELNGTCAIRPAVPAGYGAVFVLDRNIYCEEVRGQTHQSMQYLEFQWRHSAAKLGRIGTGLLAALQQLEQRCIHAVGLRGSGPKAFEVQDGRAQEGDLEEKKTTARHIDNLLSIKC